MTSSACFMSTPKKGLSHVTLAVMLVSYSGVSGLCVSTSVCHRASSVQDYDLYIEASQFFTAASEQAASVQELKDMLPKQCIAVIHAALESSPLHLQSQNVPRPAIPTRPRVETPPLSKFTSRCEKLP